MLIRLGYEIAISCAQPTPVISLLEVHKDRQKDIKRQTKVLASPPVPISVYDDLFGNTCRRFTAPEGGVQILYDAIVEDSGEPEQANFLARETPVEELPDDAIVYLLGSRYCETDHMMGVAWQLLGHLPPGWARVQAIVDYVHNRLSFGYGYARATRTAAQAHDERVGVCRDFAHLAITLCRCMNIPARYVNGYLGDQASRRPRAHGLQRLDRSLSRRKVVHIRPAPQHAAHGRVVIARGRDATDIPLLHSFGSHSLSTFKVWTYEENNPAERSPLVGDIDRTVGANVLA